MGSSLTLIQLPAQSGKTRKMTDLINKWNSTFNISKACDLNIIFTSNTKLLNKQTHKRIIRDVDNYSESSSDDDDEIETRDVPKTFSWTHGQKKIGVDNVFVQVTCDDDETEINNIICCTNKKRMEHVMSLLNMLLKKFRKRNFNKDVNIWIDEADSSIGIWHPHFDRISEMCAEKFIKNVVLITATMRPVYKHFHSIGVEPNLRTYENTHAPVYHKYSECELIHDISDRHKRVDDALKEILRVHADKVIPGSKWFCPGNTKCASHELHCSILMEHGFNVLIINGQYKEFRLQNGDVYPIKEDLEEDLEVSKTLSRYYYELELFNAPFAVTGKMCVSRGITFASSCNNEFLFTHGVIPDNTNGDDAYQMVMRCGGNIKGYATYQKPILFVSTKTSELILKEEGLAVEFAMKYWNGEEDHTIQVTVEMIQEPISRKNHSVDETKFRVIRGESAPQTIDIIKEIVINVFGESFRKPTLDNATKKYKTSLNTKSEVVSLLDAVKKVPGAYGTNNGVKTYRRFFPSYLNDTLYIVIPLIDESYTIEKINRLDNTYKSYMVPIPQEGDIDP